jgi:hypothetical protein
MLKNLRRYIIKEGNNSILGRKGATYFEKEGVRMKKYIFVTPEGLTYKPNCDSPEPDFPDVQIIDYSHNATVDDALKDLMEINGNLFENKSAQNFTIRLETNHKNSLWLRERKPLATIAS